MCPLPTNGAILIVVFIDKMKGLLPQNIFLKENKMIILSHPLFEDGTSRVAFGCFCAVPDDFSQCHHQSRDVTNSAHQYNGVMENLIWDQF